MILDLSTSEELKIRLDPTQAEDRIPSVAFNVMAGFMMPFQQTSIIIKDCWFSHAALREFEEELSRLVAQTIGSAILLNMSEVPIIAIERAIDTMVTRIQATDTAGIGRVVLEVRGHPSEVSEMLEKIRAYPKWW